MSKKASLRLSLLLFFSVFALFAQESESLSAAQIPNPVEAGTGYVTSIGGFLTAGEIADINARIAAIEKESSVEIALVVVPSLEEDIFTVAQSLFDAWEIGKADRDNGLLIIASIGDRDFRTHTGYGMEGIFTDAAISYMQNGIVMPEFKEGHYGAGIIKYIAKIGDILREPAALAEVVSGADRSERLGNFRHAAVPVLIFGLAGLSMLIGSCVSLWREIRSVRANKKIKRRTYSRIAALEGKSLGKGGFGVPIFMFPFGAVFFSIGLVVSGLFGVSAILVLGLFFPLAGLILSILSLVWSNRERDLIIKGWRSVPRSCPECGLPMEKLSETDDDKYLSPLQTAEEKIKSEDYDVWLCPSCGATTVEKFRAGKYALYTSCPSCASLAARQTKREVVSSPTYSSAGEAALHFECLACAHAFIKKSVIPRLTRSTGSSGSGGSGGSRGSSHNSSSFGGGSSGGGGSTSHW